MPKFLMCRPDCFSVSYKINPWMEPEKWTPDDLFLAKKQWAELAGTLYALGCDIYGYDRVSNDIPDLVFTANHAVVYNGEAVLANFASPEREKEEPYIDNRFASLLKFDVVKKNHIIAPYTIRFEGAGDCIIDPSKEFFWMGYGQRTHLAAHKYVGDFLKKPYQSLELVDPRFYHLDTCFLPLSDVDVMFYPEAFSEASQDLIFNHFHDCIVLSEEEACNLAANAIVLGDDVVISGASEEIKEDLAGFGYRVHEVDLSSFRKSGGSAYCLTLRLDNHD